MTTLAIGGTLQLMLMAAAVIAVFYLLVQRPMRKRQKEAADTLNTLDAGTRVLLTSGIIATVKHLGNKQAVVELAPGVEVTVLKQVIVRVVPPADEEFEYEDSAADAEPSSPGAFAEPAPQGATAGAAMGSAAGGEGDSTAMSDLGYPQPAGESPAAGAEQPPAGI